MSAKLSYDSKKVFDRLNALKYMREKLCKKEVIWQEAFAANDWVVEQLKILLTIADESEKTKEDLKERINDILCAIDMGEDNE